MAQKALLPQIDEWRVSLCHKTSTTSSVNANGCYVLPASQDARGTSVFNYNGDKASMRIGEIIRAVKAQIIEHQAGSNEGNLAYCWLDVFLFYIECFLYYMEYFLGNRQIPAIMKSMPVNSAGLLHAKTSLTAAERG